MKPSTPNATPWSSADANPAADLTRAAAQAPRAYEAATTPTPPSRSMDLLWSYVYARNLDLKAFLEGLAAPRIRFFADSGAHSARTLGLDLQIQQYAQWLTEHQDWCTIYANLDVIGGPDATRVNQDYLESQGLHPVPVFHTGEPFSVLEDYIADGYTYIALGKLLGNSQKDLTPWIARCFEVAGDRAVFHGFGLTVWDQLRRFPWYSVDSSSWGAGVRYGQVRLFDRGRWVPISLRDRKAVRDNLDLLRSYRLSPRDMTSGHYNRAAVAGACAVAQYRAAEWLTRRHGVIGLPPGKGYPPPSAPVVDKIVRLQPGPNDTRTQYLAEGSPHGHAWHADAFTMYLADSSSRWTPVAAQAIAQEQAQ